MIRTLRQIIKSLVFKASISYVKTDTAMFIYYPGVPPYYSVASDSDYTITSSLGMDRRPTGWGWDRSLVPRLLTSSRQISRKHLCGKTIRIFHINELGCISGGKEIVRGRCLLVAP